MSNDSDRSLFVRAIAGGAASENWALWALKFILATAAAVVLSAMLHTGTWLLIIWLGWFIWGCFFSNPMKWHGRRLLRIPAWIAMNRRAREHAEWYAELPEDVQVRYDLRMSMVSDWEAFCSTVGIGIAYMDLVEVKRGQFEEVPALATPDLFDEDRTPYGLDVVISVLGDRGQTVADIAKAADKIAAFLGEKVVIVPDPEKPHARAVIQIHAFDVLATTETVQSADHLDDWFAAPSAPVDLNDLFETDGGF